MTVTWPVAVELAEAKLDLARERRVLYLHERADLESRVANRGIWRNTLRRCRERIRDLEQLVADLERKVGHED